MNRFMSQFRTRNGRIALAAAVSLLLGYPFVAHASDKPDRGEDYHRDFVFGAPANPTEEWALASGGRIYDKWWDALGGQEPKETHPAYPAIGKQKGAGTWRCKECHGWDYKGVAGAYSSGGRFTGIKGVAAAAGRDPKNIAALLRDKTHGYTPAMIPDEALERLALFVSKGQHETDPFIDKSTKRAKGDAERGHKLYQAVCAACHGFDGKTLNFGDEKTPEYVGTLAASNPWEAMHKVRNGQPGSQMPNLRVFDLQTSIDIIAYAQTLPTK